MQLLLLRQLRQQVVQGFNCIEGLQNCYCCWLLCCILEG